MSPLSSHCLHIHTVSVTYLKISHKPVWGHQVAPSSILRFSTGGVNKVVKISVEHQSHPSLTWPVQFKQDPFDLFLIFTNNFFFFFFVLLLLVL